MRILVIADEEQVAMEPGSRADLLISCGDLNDAFIVRVADAVACRDVIALKGNHDSLTPFEPPILDLHMTVLRYGGLSFAGFNGSWRYKPFGHFLYEQDEVEALIEDLPAVDVFVAHNSPYGIHHKQDHVHLGFSAFNKYIERARPRFFIHGHQHVNTDTAVGDTQVIGVFGHRWLHIDDLS